MLARAIQEARREVADFQETSGVPADRLAAFLAADWPDARPPTAREMRLMAAVLGIAPGTVAGWLHPDRPPSPIPSVAEAQRKQEKHRRSQQRRKENAAARRADTPGDGSEQAQGGR